MNIKKSILLRARIAFLIVMLFALAVIYRLFVIQMVEGGRWRKMAEQQVFSYREVKATRGNIYSEDGYLLATSLPFYRLSFDPGVSNDQVFNQHIDSLSLLLSTFFKEKNPSEYKRKLLDARKTGKRYLRLSSRMLNYQEKKTVSQWPLFSLGKNKGGVLFEKVDRRFRPFHDLGLRTVGFVNEDSKGVGLEYSFDQTLTGQHGRALFQRVSGGHWKPVLDGSEVRAKEGYDIVTTLDVNLQDVAQAALKKHLSEHHADYGCVVLMEVNTGHIKAMANLGKNEHGNYIEKYNYAVGSHGITEPGSTFKLASILALLEEKHSRPGDTIDTGKGVFEFYDKKMTDAKEEGYGRITMSEAFSKSSNIGISRLVHDCFYKKPDAYLDYMQRFGLTEAIPFQMASDARPFFRKPSDKRWSGTTLPWMSIGYEVQLSPIHMLTFYNAIANKGKMISPIIVKEIKQADQVIQTFEPQIIKKKICSDRTLAEAHQMLIQVVDQGTAKNVKNNNYKLAGKTGTAQKVVNGRYTRSYYTSFIGYFPADAPKYSCIVIIDNPKGFRQYANDVAAPVFKEIADKIFATDLKLHQAMKPERNVQAGVFPVVRSGYHEDLHMLCNTMGLSNHLKQEAEWVVAKPVRKAIQWQSKDPKKGLVPDVVGMTLRDALYLLENNGVQASFRGRGRVVAQSPSPGINIQSVGKVNLTLESL